jgi:hypothetical protein
VAFCGPRAEDRQNLIARLKEDRGIVCAWRTTGDGGVGATLTHDYVTSGKADSRVEAQTRSNAA